MVQGLKFLCKKGFHPQNKANVEKVWRREQEKKNEARRIKEREDQLKREREEEELNRARGFETKVDFLYKPPPGFETSAPASSKEASRGAGPSSVVGTERQPGDDDAAAAFRRMLAQGTVNEDQAGGTNGQLALNISRGAFSLQGGNAEYTDRKIGEGLSELEKAAGRKNGAAMTTFEEQVKRFPALKNAPRAKGTSADTVVTFNPLGARIRNVKCAACGQWGHGKNDRECQMTGWDPFSGKLQVASYASVPTPRDGSPHRTGEGNEDDISSDDSRTRRKRKHRKSDKKHRKRKKERKHQRYDSSDDESVKRRHRRKEKRRRRSNSFSGEEDK